MRIERSLVVLFLAMLCISFPASPQASKPKQQETPQGHATQSVVRQPHPEFMPMFKKTVALLRTGFLVQQGGKRVPIIESGTAFFVGYPDARLGKGRMFGYLVTNRHMVQPEIETGHPHQPAWMALVLNKTAPVSGEEPVATQVPLSTTSWHFPKDDSVDLAVLPFAPDPTKFECAYIPLSVFATREVVQKQQIMEGDKVLFTGYFYQFPGLTRFDPIVREGIIAMMPNDEMSTTLGKRGHIYLADVHAFHGNSGSPLLVNLGGFRNGAVRAGYDYRLLGVISGYYHEDANLTLTVAATVTGKIEENSGIAMVVPADELKALLDSPQLQAVRDAQVAATRSKK